MANQHNSIMKQPNLGKRIAELRKTRGLTQEELVEKCNVSVRTIQRIESGEVTPRSYTVRAILDTLGYELGEITEPQTEDELWDNAESSKLKVLKNLLPWSIAAGFLYFVLGFMEASLDLARSAEFGEWFEVPGSQGFYNFIKIAILIAINVFIFAFYKIGDAFKSSGLKLGSVIFMVACTLFVLYDISSYAFPALENDMAVVSEIILFGVAYFILGIGLYTARNISKTIASLATMACVFNGLLFISVIGIIPGYLFLPVTELLLIILLFKVYTLVKDQGVTPLA
jgi:transcriptional regulator with XRE-family HTH domain